MPNSLITTPCPDKECKDGFILVRNIYNPDPLKAEKQVCDICQGKGYVVLNAREVN